MSDEVAMIASDGPSDSASRATSPRRRKASKSADMPAAQGQLRIAEEFAGSYRGKLIHNAALGWHQWCGSHWKPVADKVATAAAQRLLRVLLHRAVEMPANDRDQWFRDVRRCETANALTGVVKLASGMPGISVEDDELDARPELLAFPNGTYDLSTNGFRPAQPADYLTRVMGCRYDPGARCPTYDRVMAEAQPTEDRRAYLHRIVGSALEGTVREHAMPVFDGTGGNGKGTILNDSWLPAFGDYGIPMPVEILLASRGRDYMTERLSLRGVRLVITSEPPKSARFNAALMKLLSGGDKLSARPLYTNTLIKWDPTHQVIMMCNYRPEPPADDGGVWRRLKPLDWPLRLPTERMDTTLAGKLARELSGIVNRILEGWRDFQDRGYRLDPPDVAHALADEWRASVDLLGAFLADRCVLAGPELRVSSSALFVRWQSWCHDNGENAGTAKDLVADMRGKGFRQVKSSGRMFFTGVSLKEAAP